MPAYEYQCEQCQVHFEKRQKMSDDALQSCPECGGSVRRLISGGAGAISKGSSPAAGPHPCEMGAPCCGQGMCGGMGCACEN